jgi:hypothetical protein
MKYGIAPHAITSGLFILLAASLSLSLSLLPRARPKNAKRERVKAVRPTLSLSRSQQRDAMRTPLDIHNRA